MLPGCLRCCSSWRDCSIRRKWRQQTKRPREHCDLVKELQLKFYQALGKKMTRVDSLGVDTKDGVYKYYKIPYLS